MNQRYKFFMGSGAITLNVASPIDAGVSAHSDEEVFEQMTNLVEAGAGPFDATFYCTDPRFIVARVRAYYPVIQAGGGYVINDKGELLMIKRRGFWDLPKGKIEKGETMEHCAVREVEEECGIDRLELLSPAFLTWHFYQEKGKWTLKESHWFKMRCNHHRVPIAQSEEDITIAQWTPLPVPEWIVNSAFGSIREVLNHFGL